MRPCSPKAPFSAAAPPSSEAAPSSLAPASSQAWYLYAVLADDADAAGGYALQDAAAILTGSRVGAVMEAGLAALVSRVPRGLFEAKDPDNRASDPAWVAVCAEAHHRVVQIAAEAGACLPFGFGTVFASEHTLRLWLSGNAIALRAALAEIADRQEWALTLTEDAPAHTAWLETHEAGLRQLAEAARSASPGTGFLLERRLVRAREEARVQHVAASAARLADCLEHEGMRVRAEFSNPEASRQAGSPAPAVQPGQSWSVLAERQPGQGERLAALGCRLLGDTGLRLRVTGPWPPYAFARAAWQENAHG